MPQLPLYSIEGKSVGEQKASEEIFGKKPNQHAVHSALTWFLASKRRGTHSSKTRAEVRGGGAKPWRQKGTGRARAGSIRSPLWRKGGVIFGPKPRSYSYALPKKVRKLAIKIALSDKTKENKVKIVEGFKLDQPKTKLAAKLLGDLGVSGKTLLILAKENEIFKKASRNLAGVEPVAVGNLNIFDLLMADWVVIEKVALARLEEVLA
jgi:large subunit ribosomal protein L4